MARPLAPVAADKNKTFSQAGREGRVEDKKMAARAVSPRVIVIVSCNELRTFRMNWL